MLIILSPGLTNVELDAICYQHLCFLEDQFSKS